LSASRIANHYSIGKLGPNPLTITRSGSNVIVTFPAGTLQQASTVNGTYTDVTTTSPYVTPASGAQKYYRVKL
jgi:hypothetical protein